MSVELLAKETSEFVASLLEDPAVLAFRSAEQNLDSDPGFIELRDAYNDSAQRFREKQADGTLEQQDIEALRELQNRVNTHPAAQRFIEARERIASLIQECNHEISGVLGFDFGAAAGPRGGCSC